jgi:hypothetical protein
MKLALLVFFILFVAGSIVTNCMDPQTHVEKEIK